MDNVSNGYEIDEIITNISSGVSAKTGEEFFTLLVQKLSELFKLDYAFIGILDEGKKGVTTLRFCVDGKIEDNIHYELKNTPCNHVVGNETCCYDNSIQSEFPKDKILFDWNIESYIGTPLFDKSGNPIGIIAGLSKVPFKNSTRMIKILEIFASRASAEIERINTYHELETTIAQLLAAQNHLVDSEKMVSIGSLVAGFTHEINTPIGLSVTGASYLKEEAINIQKSLNEEKLTKQNLNDFLEKTSTLSSAMLVNLSKAVDLIKSFKQISVDQHLNSKREFNLHTYIESVILSMSSVLKPKQIEIENKSDSSINIYANPGVYSQIFTNLINNSILHGIDGDNILKISIEAYNDGDNIIITHRDNGKGIEESVLPNIFDQFFTTKQNNGGSGLGLHIIKRLVSQNLCGDITCESTHNNGTTFTITVPNSKE